MAHINGGPAGLSLYDDVPLKIERETFRENIRSANLDFFYDKLEKKSIVEDNCPMRH